MVPLLATAFVLGLSPVRWHGTRSLVSPPRSGHTAAADANGNVWLFGGYAEYADGKPRDVVSDLWRYSSGAWECIQPPAPRGDTSRPGPRLATACAVLDNELLMVGGWDPEEAGTGGSILDDVWALDLETQKWSRCAPMPRGPSSRHIAAVVGGNVIVHTFRCLDSVLVWDASSRALVEQPTSGTPPSSRGLHVGAALGEHTLIVFGGAAKDGGMSNEAYALDTRTWAWTQLASAPESGGGFLGKIFGGGEATGSTPSPRAGACAASVDGGVIVCCGAEASLAGLTPRADCWKLNVDEEDYASASWELLLSDEAEGAPGARNAASLVPLGPGQPLLLTGGWRPFVSTYEDSYLLDLGPAPTEAGSGSKPPQGAEALTASDKAEALFSEYAAAAPPVQGGLYQQCWAIVREALDIAAPSATCDASAFDGALEAFVAAGPDDPASIPEAQRALLAQLQDTAASYVRLVDDSTLSWATCYRTLNKPLGAYFCGFSLWPKASKDVPNLTLYFGSGSAVNPDRIFMRLEMIPRVDTDTDAAYAEQYYRPYNDRFFALLENSAFEPYVSDSAYARGAQAPSGLRYFFDGNAENLQIAADAVRELATQWAGFVDDGAELPTEVADALASRDATIRRVAADNSPDNANRERVFGAETFARTKALLSGDGALGL